MKKNYLVSLAICLCFFVFLPVQGQSNILFFDDFEEEIAADGSFSQWTTENLEGWHYWHIIPWGGMDGSQCMRFERNDLRNHDWLISNAIDCADADSLLISFNYLYDTGPVKPRLLYTGDYGGDALAIQWTEIDMSLDPEVNDWHEFSKAIAFSGNTIYLAFQYEADPDEAMYFLLDNFKVQTHETVVFEKVGETEHFLFYTHMPEYHDFWNQMASSLEEEYNKLSGMWNRPGMDNVFPQGNKCRVFYTDRDCNQLLESNTPPWKCGFFRLGETDLVLSPLETAEQEEFYMDLSGLAVNTFSQMAIVQKYLRENIRDFPPYFLEGFGLYESGFRPNRDSVLAFYADYPEMDYEIVTDTSGITQSYRKDMIVCNIEGQLLSGWSYISVNPGASTYRVFQWPKHLEYYYFLPEDNRIKLQRSTAWFDFYGASSDTAHLGEIITYYQKARSSYIELYQYDPGHRYNIVVFPTPEIGADIMVYNDYNGGSGCGGDKVDCISPNYNWDPNVFYSKYFGYSGMNAHEFFHIYYHHFMWDIPGGFWAEGSADFSARHSLNWEIPQHSLWKITELFGAYADRHPSVEINLEHIVKNPNLELDIYFLGDMFFEYLWEEHGGFLKIREFFNSGMDYSVFESSYEEIDRGYIAYLKGLVGISSVAQADSFGIRAWLERDILFIRGDLGVQGPMRLRLFNLSGQELVRREQTDWKGEALYFPLSDIRPGGLYIVTLEAGSHIFTQKVVNAY